MGRSPSSIRLQSGGRCTRPGFSSASCYRKPQLRESPQNTASTRLGHPLSAYRSSSPPRLHGHECCHPAFWPRPVDHWIASRFSVEVMIAISNQLQRFLANSGPKTVPEILRDHPELNTTPDAGSVLYLLLRLNRRFRVLDNGRWAAAVSPQTEADRIVAVTQAFLDQFPSSGLLLKTVVDYVTAQTGYSSEKIRSVVVGSFDSNGMVVINRPKN